ncbi:S1 family peptidase [Streptomyces hesseae]|uniref:S1 family peptidase n=1 Tax=Streptomyces hesseae TaxID=3075519 RepID=A0ABU2SSQ5_9ACTN|nr:S1 family peptidase [Streptomyces sp. DSM 40473]MDT0452037.1 S1 family peptidase [Streptomyces sp. DSM 40473]
MSGKTPRVAWIAGVLASSVAASILTGTQAHAVVGDEAKDGQYAFTAKLDIGDGKRSCTGALVESQWVLTAASCFADDPSQGFRITGGAPKMPTKVTVGRTDLTRETGTTVDAVELVPRGDRDLVMVKLKSSVADVMPVSVANYAPKQGDEFRVAGYGRTKDEWAPERLHHGAFGVSGVSATGVQLNGTSADGALCKGDTGSPAFREVNGKPELAAINTNFWQGGCFGTDEAEKRKGVAGSRVDDVADWVQQTYARTLLSRSNWKNAVHLASGHFTDGGATNSKRRMDLFVVWADGSASLFQGSDSSTPEVPFVAEYKLAGAGSYWKGAKAITGTRVAESGSDGLTVRWENGKLSTYTHVDAQGFHDEKTLAAVGSWYKHAKMITAGRFTGNALRDDLLVLWDDGSTSMYSDTGVNGVEKQTQLTKADAGWGNAQQIAAGEFAGKKTADLMVQWNDGQNQVLPGVDTAGYHGRTEVRSEKSAWKNIAQMTVGNFTSANGGPSDLLIRWNDGNLSYYPGVTGTGTPNKEVQLVG